MKKTKIVKSKTTINTKVILAVLAFSAFIAVFNETILNVALNTLMKEMKVTAGTIQCQSNSYINIIHCTFISWNPCWTSLELGNECI